MTYKQDSTYYLENYKLQVSLRQTLGMDIRNWGGSELKYCISKGKYILTSLTYLIKGSLQATNI